MTTHLLALSVKQPMSWALVSAGKDIENRSQDRQFKRHRGTLAIHASRTTSRADWDDYAETIAHITGRPCPAREALAFGAIVGLVDLVDIVGQSDSPWFDGPVGLVVANPRPLVTPAPCTGALGLWVVPPAIREAIRRQGLVW